MFKKLGLGWRKGTQKLWQKVSKTYEISADDQYSKIIQIFQIERKRVQETEKKLMNLIKSIQILEKTYSRPQNVFLDVFRDFADDDEQHMIHFLDFKEKVGGFQDSMKKFISHVHAEAIAALRDYLKEYEDCVEILHRREEVKIHYDDQVSVVRKAKENLEKRKQYPVRNPREELYLHRLASKLHHYQTRLVEIREVFRVINRDAKAKMVQILKKKADVYKPLSQVFFSVCNTFFTEVGENVTQLRNSMNDVGESLNGSFKTLVEELPEVKDPIPTTKYSLPIVRGRQQQKKQNMKRRMMLSNVGIGGFDDSEEEEEDKGPPVEANINLPKPPVPRQPAPVAPEVPYEQQKTGLEGVEQLRKELPVDPRIRLENINISPPPEMKGIPDPQLQGGDGMSEVSLEPKSESFEEGISSTDFLESLDQVDEHKADDGFNNLASEVKFIVPKRTDGDLSDDEKFDVDNSDDEEEGEDQE